MIQLCSVLAYLHDREPKILHLDLKPDNILVNNGKLYLIDFGSAVEGAGRREGGLTGTPGFAAPECYQGEAREQSDIFSAGKLMEFMLRKRMPQEAQKSFQKMPSAQPEPNRKNIKKGAC